MLAANAALIELYWELGRTILARQSRDGWGAKVVDRFACDLRDEFPDMEGLSPRNLLFMRSFAEAYTDPKIVKQLVSQLPEDPGGKPTCHKGGGINGSAQC